jgi:hypothetical protein
VNILLFVPQTRIIQASLNSIAALDTAGHTITVHCEYGEERPPAERWADVTRKYQIGRQMALDGGYDAMLCIEDDQIVPPDALRKLVACDADIAYGLTVTRREPHLWAATIVCGPNDGDYESYDMRPDAMRAAWGRVVPVIGCGLYCTLIRRHVLEALPFELRGSRCCDFYHAYDAYRAGYTQLCDTTITCGHVMEDGRVVYPDVDSRFRYEEMVTA